MVVQMRKEWVVELWEMDQNLGVGTQYLWWKMWAVAELSLKDLVCILLVVWEGSMMVAVG